MTLKWNKDNPADPSVDLIRVKNMLNSTISMSYPDVVIACIGIGVSGLIQTIDSIQMNVCGRGLMPE